MPVIGWIQEMEKLDWNRAFYDKYYTPNSAVLVASDVEPETVKALAEKTYGTVPAAPGLTGIRPFEPQQNAKRAVTLTDMRISVSRFSTQWVVPSYRTASPGEAEALDLLAEILGGCGVCHCTWSVAACFADLAQTPGKNPATKPSGDPCFIRVPEPN